MIGVEEEQETGVMESGNIQRQKVPQVLPRPAPECAQEGLELPGSDQQLFETTQGELAQNHTQSSLFEYLVKSSSIVLYKRQHVCVYIYIFVPIRTRSLV